MKPEMDNIPERNFLSGISVFYSLVGYKPMVQIQAFNTQ